MNALVTGGGGFLGRRIVELLLEQGHRVSILARGRYPEVEALGARGISADLCDRDALFKAVQGHDVVFHAAARAGFWGDLADYWGPNVEGTRHLLDAMEAHGVGRMIYTSTPSVVGYDHDVVNGKQDLPYAERHGSPYPESKAEAERMVLASNSKHVATVALRPHLIFGPRDTNLFPRVLERARDGKLPMIGDGTATVDYTYVDNAAWAHLDALDALTSHEAPCAGKAYFISNDEPVLLWDWFNQLLPRVGAPPITRQVSKATAQRIGGVMELAWRWLPLSGEPRMTRFMAAALSMSHWYDMTPAKRDFGYRIRVPMAEATERQVEWMNSQQR